MPTVCKAQNQATCRVHGTEGAMIALQIKADTSVKEGRLDDYIKIREEMENLTDDGSKPLPLASQPPRSTGTWRDHAEDKQLVENLHTSNNTPAERLGIAASKDELVRRGYSESEIYAAIFFKIDKNLVQHEDGYDSNYVRMNVGSYINMAMHVEDVYDTELPDARIKQIAQKYLGFDLPEVSGIDRRDNKRRHKTDIQRYCAHIVQEVMLKAHADK